MQYDIARSICWEIGTYCCATQYCTAAPVEFVGAPHDVHYERTISYHNITPVIVLHVAGWPLPQKEILLVLEFRDSGGIPTCTVCQQDNSAGILLFKGIAPHYLPSTFFVQVSVDLTC